MTRSDMIRTAVACVAMMLQFSIADAAGVSKSVSVSGNLNAGTKVSASFVVSPSGAVSGAGRLFGTNPNGTNYSYPFTVNRATTTSGKLVVTGAFLVTGSPPVSLSATVPSGAQKFEYTINGKSVVYTGTGTVTVK